MFLGSDKDLRKAVPKKVPVKTVPKSSTNVGISSSFACTTVLPSTSVNVVCDNILDQAKAEREQRILKRELVHSATIVQSWWRGRHKSHHYYAQLLTIIDNKLGDIDKLSKLLVSKGLPSLVPPCEICLTLLKTFHVVVKHSKKDHTQRLARCCQLLLIPTLSQLEPQNNIMLAEFKRDPTFPILSHSFRLMIDSLVKTALVSTRRQMTSSNKLIPSNEQVNPCDLYCECLSLLVGRGEPYKMKYTYDLGIAFDRYRAHLVDDCCAFLFLRKYFMQAVSPLMANRSVEDGGASSRNKHPTTAAGGGGGVSDQMFELAQFLVRSDPKRISDRLDEFQLCVFSVPLLTLVLSESCLRAFCSSSTSDLLGPLLTSIAVPEMVHFPAYLQVEHVITSHQWVMGNLTALIGFISIVDSKPLVASVDCSSGIAPHSASLAVSDEVLITYLNVLGNWLSGGHMIPGLLQGREAIVWRHSGASSTAVGVPAGLETQILSVLDVKVLRALCERVVSPSVAEDWGRYTTPQDAKEISDALSSSGYVVAQTALRDQQAAATWFSSKWAEKLTSSVQKTFTLSSLLPSFFGGSSSSSSSSSSASTNNKKAKSNAESPAAVESNSTSTSKPSSSDTECQSPVMSSKISAYKVVPELQTALGKIWCLLLPVAAAASSGADTVPRKALTFLAFSSGGTVIERLWVALLVRSGGSSSLDKLASRVIFDVSSPRNVFSGESSLDGAQFDLLMSLVAVLRVALIALDDSELYEQSKPLPLHQTVALIRCLKVVLYRMIHCDPHLMLEAHSETAEGDRMASSSSSSSSSSDQDEANKNLNTHRFACARSISAVLSDLYTRWARRPFSFTSLWEIGDTSTSAVKDEIRRRTPFAVALLRVMPWSVDFHQRMKLFRSVADAERGSIQGVNDIMSGGSGYRSQGQVIRVRKARILEDGMAAMGKISGSAIKDRVVVRYVNEFGEDEAGIDIGGLFKDFVTDLSARIFDPNYGLFCLTASNVLYPNPAAAMLFDRHELDEMYVFLGRVLGKALFENITLQPQFAHFFLAFMHGRYNFMSLVNDLSTLDPELYRNLMFLKAYEGDIADLALTFSVSDTALGGNSEIELVPGGAELFVNSSNRYRYVNLVAKYYLHDRLKRQAGAFFSGLYQVISPDQLGIFCAPELQILISGAQTGVDVDDLKRNTRYAGGYLGAVDRHVGRFWAVVDELSPEDRALLVKFVTSCERPPSLGFVGLIPPFTIQRVECSDDSRLPTASTCFNILKLPTYSSQKVLRDKLLKSIRSKAGFDLS